MLSIKLCTLISFSLVNVSLLFNQSHASDPFFGDSNDSGTFSPPMSPVTKNRFSPDPKTSSTQDSIYQSCRLDLSVNDAATIADDAITNDTFAMSYPSLTTSLKPTQSEDEGMGFVTVTNAKAEFMIKDTTFKTLIIPEPISPFKKIMIIQCTCYNSIDAASFQNNPELTHLILTGSYINWGGSEEKLGEGCPLEYIDLKGTVDISIDKEAPITPERFAQLIHPDILLRILNAQCELFILNPTTVGMCYSVDEMREKFLRSLVERRSDLKSQEGIYQTLIGLLPDRVKDIDPSKVVGLGVRAAFTACTGI
jgi:hypothetical protein